MRGNGRGGAMQGALKGAMLRIPCHHFTKSWPAPLGGAAVCGDSNSQGLLHCLALLIRPFQQWGATALLGNVGPSCLEQMVDAQWQGGG